MTMTPEEERDAELRMLEVYMHPGKFIVTMDVSSCSDCGEYVSSGAFKWCQPCLYKRLLARLRSQQEKPVGYVEVSVDEKGVRRVWYGGRVYDEPLVAAPGHTVHPVGPAIPTESETET